MLKPHNDTKINRDNKSLLVLFKDDRQIQTKHVTCSLYFSTLKATENNCQRQSNSTVMPCKDPLCSFHCSLQPSVPCHGLLLHLHEKTPLFWNGLNYTSIFREAWTQFCSWTAPPLLRMAACLFCLNETLLSVAGGILDEVRCLHNTLSHFKHFQAFSVCEIYIFISQPTSTFKNILKALGLLPKRWCTACIVK